MKTIGDVLIESDKTRVQISGHLVNVDSTGTPIEYCALGALACENGLIGKTNVNYDINLGLSYRKILESYGVNPYTKIMNPISKKMIPLLTALYRLNDGGWTFKQIGEYIKTLEDKGIIKYGEEHV